MGQSETQAGLIRNAVLIAGPTASGKSRLALKLAQRHGGVIVNTDSMQVYSVLNVLTARPGPDELRAAPHRLYGHVHPRTAYSTGGWLRDVTALAKSGEFNGQRPIFVGGTGLYFRALTGGISEMPEIPDAIRDHWRNEMQSRGPSALHEALSRKDPAAAAMLRPTDGQRIARALEVMEASGRSILEWQGDRGRPVIDLASARMMVLDIDRQELVARINTRFDQMVANGALEEVRTLSELSLDPSLPAMKAVGVRELQAVLSGQKNVEQAMQDAKIATRQYAKRQATWFRNQFGPEWQRVGSQDAAIGALLEV